MAGPAVDAGGALIGRDAAADRQRAQRNLSVHAAAGAHRRAGAGRAQDTADRIRRSFPGYPARGAGHGDTGGRLCPSQLGHGPQDLGGFGHADEQGPGADRGVFSVRTAARAGRNRRPPAEHRALDGRVPGRLCPCAAGVTRYANAHRACTCVARANRLRCRLPRFGPGWPVGFQGARRWGSFRA